jgi:hypothetical protein
MKPLINTHEFLSLSSFLNYQLSGSPINWQGVLSLLLEQKLDNTSETFLKEALELIGDAYGKQKRRLGPLAVLHPIRTASLLAKASGKPDTLDLLCAFFHDKNEDRYNHEDWQRLDNRFRELLGKIDSETGWFLNERIDFLAKNEGETYTRYLGRLLSKAKETPELAAVKLADRLDNTLDLRIDLHDVEEHTHSFQCIFDIMFANAYSGMQTKQQHPVNRKINGAMRLYQLYKNTVLLSMLRDEQIALNNAAQKLFFSLAIASIREAQTIMLHIFTYHRTDPAEQRSILLEVMEYSHNGGFESINEEGCYNLDGLFRKYFVHDSPEAKKQCLNNLYDNKRLMGLVAVGFLVIFSNFINSDTYLIRGISSSGVIPQQQ